MYIIYVYTDSEVMHPEQLLTVCHGQIYRNFRIASGVVMQCICISTLVVLDFIFYATQLNT